jgi:outer membrane protein assembly factor BamD
MTPSSARIPTGRLLCALLFALLATALAGCATPGTPAPDTDTAAYQQVTAAVARGDCAGAQGAVQAMESAHPGSIRLADAYLEAGYACLRSGELEATEALVSGFRERFPGHRSADYAHYLHALSAYARWRGLPPGTPGARSSEAAREAFGRFRALLIAYPDTAYAADVRPLLLDLREGLARVELDAMRADLDARRHEAVIPRGRYLLTHYGNTESAPYALAALVQAHLARGEEDEARRLRQQLESDWPDHPALRSLEGVR